MENQFGKLSKLQLVAGVKDGKTVLDEAYFTAPFKVMQPFYEKKGFMTAMQLMASAGVMAGDRMELDIRVREHACMEFVSQSYEKIHRMPEGCAMRHTHLSVGPHACLHYMPLPTIPFADSDYRSDMEVELADGTSRFVLCEALACGRAARGEQFQYRKFQNKLSIYQGGKIVYRDNACYEPGRMDMHGYGMYEGFTHLASLVICNEPKTEGWYEKVQKLLDQAEGIEGGATRTVAGHAVVKALGTSGQKLTQIMERILEQ